MYVSANDLKNNGYLFVYARTVAAASLFVSKDPSRPILQCLQIVTDDAGKVSVNSTDSYKLGHFESMKFALCDSEKGTEILLNIIELGKFVPTSPKASDWLAIRETERYGQKVVEVTKISTNTSSESVVTMGQTTYVPQASGHFPDWEVLVNNATSSAKKASVNTTPTLNTSYLATCFKAIDIAVSYTGAAGTNLIHGSKKHEPVMLEASNDGGEYALVLLMPVNTAPSRISSEVRDAAEKAANDELKARVKLEKENAKLKNELNELKATLAEIDAGKAA